MTDRTIDFANASAAIKQRSSRSVGTAASSSGTRAEPDFRIRQYSSAVAKPSLQVPIDTLYPEAQSDDIGKALSLLAEGIDIFESARNETDVIGADRQVLRFQAILPLLFGCRSIGDGFAVVVNSLQFAFVNLHGKPLVAAQITTIWRTLKSLRLRPFVAFEQAMELVEDLEKSGLEVDPAVLPDILAEEQDD